MNNKQMKVDLAKSINLFLVGIKAKVPMLGTIDAEHLGDVLETIRNWAKEQDITVQFASVDSKTMAAGSAMGAAFGFTTAVLLTASPVMILGATALGAIGGAAVTTIQIRFGEEGGATLVTV